MDCIEADSDEPRFETFRELQRYSELVASAVGIACIHIWGFNNPAAVEPARQCGIAFQLTNILRDLKQDADAGRIYLPQEDFERVGYTAPELRRGVRDHRFAALMRLEIERTEAYYRRASELQNYLDSAGQRIFGAMFSTYRGLLEKIKKLDTAVLGERVQLTRLQKLRIIGRCCLFREKLNIAEPLPGAAT
jgi:phytoene synthase